jgi:hypothetical protein
MIAPKFYNGRAGFKALTLRSLSVFAAPFLRQFRVNLWKFEDSGRIEQNVTDEPKAMKKIGETELSVATLGRHLTVHKLPRNFCVVLKSLICEHAAWRWSAPDTLTINHISPVFLKKKNNSVIIYFPPPLALCALRPWPSGPIGKPWPAYWLACIFIWN